MAKKHFLFLALGLVSLLQTQRSFESLDSLASALKGLDESPVVLPPSDPSSDGPSGGPTGGPPMLPSSSGASGGPPGPPPPPGPAKGGKKGPAFKYLTQEDIEQFERLKKKFKKPSTGRVPDSPSSPVSDGPVKSIEQEIQEKGIAVIVALSPLERINRVKQAEEKQLADIELAVASIPDENQRNELQQAIDVRKKEIEKEKKILELREAIEKALRQLEDAYVLLQINIENLEAAVDQGKVPSFKITAAMQRFDEYIASFIETEKSFEKHQKNPFYNRAVQFLLDSQKIKQKQLDSIQDIQQHRAQVHDDMMVRIKKLLEE